MEALEDDFNEVQSKCSFLSEMVPGGKPYTDISGKIAVGHPGIFQGVTRYLRGESRTHTEEYAAMAVAQISQYLERFMEYIRWNATGDRTYELYSRVGEYLENCIKGLGMLHTTYDNADTFDDLRTRLVTAESLFKAGCKRYASIATSSHSPKRSKKTS